MNKTYWTKIDVQNPARLIAFARGFYVAEIRGDRTDAQMTQAQRDDAHRDALESIPDADAAIRWMFDSRATPPQGWQAIGMEVIDSGVES